MKRSVPIFTMALAAAIVISALSMPAMAQEAQDEASLIAVISKADSDWNAKQAACRLLRQKGTVASVPALAVLLTDPEMCQFARYALEAMPYPEAGNALLDALDKVKGPARGGIIATLGARREKEAVKFLMPLLNDPSDDIVRATLGALGRIATAPAMAAVFDYYGVPRESVRPAAAEAALASVQIMVQDGKGELAAPFCEKLIAADGPMYVRTSALYSLAKAQPDKAAGRILEALCSTEPMFRDTAARIVAETSGTEATMLYADALPKFNPEAQEALLRALAERKDPGAGAAVKKLIAAEQKPVRIAAIRALGALGNASDVPALVEVFMADDKEAVDAAEACLTVMPGAEVNAALAKSFATPSAVVRVKVLDLLAARRAAETLEVAAQAVVDADGALRLSALRAMAQHGGVAQAPVVLPVLTGSSESAEKTAAEKALIAFTGRDGDALLPLLTEALASAPTEAKPALLRVVSRIGNAPALETITKAMGAAEAPVADEAVRLVCEWPTVDAAPTLLTLANGEASTRQVLGLRGYIRLAGVEADPAKKAEMLGVASGLAKEGEERKLLIGAYGTLKTAQALDVLVPLLDDATVQNEAATSIIAVASELGKVPEMKSKAVEALNKAVEKCAEPTIKDRARKAVAQLG